MRWAAVAYRALSGRVPVEATERVRADPLVPVAEASAGPVSESFGAAVASALAVWPEDRPQNLAAWRAQWDGGGSSAETGRDDSPVPEPEAAGGSPAEPDCGDPPVPEPENAARPVFTGGLGGGVGVGERPGSSAPGGVVVGRRAAYGAAVAVVAVVVAGLAWLAGRDAAPGPAGTVAGAPVGENARGVERGGDGGDGGGGGVGGSGVAGVLPPDPPETARGGAAGADSEPGANAGSSAQEARDDPAPAVPPEAVEAELGLDSAGWLEIQKGLVALGLDPGTPDGRVGGGTRGAVRAYQEGAGKPATGFVDVADVATLRYAAAEADRVEEQRLAEAAVEAERQRQAEAAAEAERQRQAEQRLAEEMERQRQAEAAAEAERQRVAAAAAERRRAEEAAAEAERRQRQAELRRPGRVFRDCDSCPEMVVTPAGTFQMGSPASEVGRDDGEGPQHRVTLRSFAMGVKEVTFDEWAACVRGGGCNGYRPDDEGWGRGGRPVIDVSWEDAQAYVSWLSETTGARYRLPSESEWEYAARAGTTTAYHTGSTISTDQANYRSGVGTMPVGTFAPNAFGLYDVHGNVWEWVEDCWHGDYRGAPSDGTAWTRGGDCGRRVLRGGSWDFGSRDVRSAYRLRDPPGARNRSIGFRVSRTLD